jgi:hypothetical protein
LGGDTPDWVKNFGSSSKYPDSAYLVGFGISAEKDPAKAREDAINKALADISRRIRVGISSKTSSAIQETNLQVAEDVSVVTQSSTSLHLEGIHTETYADDDKLYALAYVKRSALADLYRAKLSHLQDELRGLVDEAQALEAKGDKTQAIEKYSSTFPVFAELEEAISVIVVAASAPAGDIDTLTISQEKVSKAIGDMVNKPIHTLDDAAWFISYTISQQDTGKADSARVAPLTYQDTKMGSRFGRYMQQLLAQKLDEQLATSGQTGAEKRSTHAPWLVSGTYWLEGENVKLFVRARDEKSGAITANSEITFPRSVIDSTLSLTPQNFAQAMSDQRVFDKDELAAGGLQVEVWTDKGSDGIVYAKDDTMKVYVRVNRPAYVRLVYHMADGRRTLLYDSYYISSNLVNQVVPVPGEFVCSEPYGAEVLQVFARTEEFEPVETVKVDGFRILKEDLQKFVAQTRGMRIPAHSTIQQAEARVMVTTLEK